LAPESSNSLYRFFAMSRLFTMKSRQAQERSKKHVQACMNLRERTAI
jgi:hypothetical protein